MREQKMIWLDGNGKLDFIDNLEMIIKAHSIGPDTSYDALVP